ncbi:AMIN-like domain-containing (lipo)protein [Corynebacterium ulceribovis]|uniref:AMIN-like domain-containing (lipo)protein n=1 Tax=Corynebacterium ulceribovis TaxID=487732 RepID=UPI00036063B3|nr:hypothetical protein [Corynebacterium ulceribovis]
MNTPQMHLRNKIVAAAALPALALATLTACGGSDSSETASSTPIAQSSLGSPDDSGVAETSPLNEEKLSLEPVSQRQSDDSMLAVSDVRLGAHKGFDRIAIELAGEGTPGYKVYYSKDAMQQGSGNPIAIDGDTILAIDLDGTTYPFEVGIEEPSMKPLRNDKTAKVAEVVNAGTFEGRTQLFIGINGEKRPFTVTQLSDPTRVVIDISAK